MVAVPARQPATRDEGDQRLVLRGVDWRTYLLPNDAIEEPGVRMAYCEGELEIMTIGRSHALYKTMIGRLLELFALERDVPLHGYGSMTLREEMKARGLEPDECYTLGHPLVDFPDLAIEVVVTHGGLDKLRCARISPRPCASSATGRARSGGRAGRKRNLLADAQLDARSCR